MSEPTGRLTLVATPIGNLGDLPPRAVEVLRRADVLAAEDTRRARKLLSHAGVPVPARLDSLREHNEAATAERLAGEAAAGAHVVYVSDAGMPAVSDPGERLVRACAERGVRVEVVPGPSAALAGLVVSGLPAERFVFEGFLPRRARERRERLEGLRGERRTAVLFESPRRVRATLGDLAAALGDDREVAVARELTKLHEEVWRGRLGAAADAVGDPLGEYVLVVGPAPAPEPPDDEAVTRALEEALAEGATKRDAAALVARELDVPKRRAYDLATSLPRSDEGSTRG